MLIRTHLVCKFAAYCCFPPVAPVVRREVGHGPSRLFVSFLSSCFSHQQFPTASIFCCCSPFFSHSFLISLNAVLPSPPWSLSPPFPSTFLTSDHFAYFSSPIHSPRWTHFYLLLTNFFLKLSYTQTSTLSSSILLLSALFIHLLTFTNS